MGRNKRGSPLLMHKTGFVGGMAPMDGRNWVACRIKPTEGRKKPMNRFLLLIAILMIPSILPGCQTSSLIRTTIDPEIIPDQTYNVTVYGRFMTLSYAVLFDIPDDGKEVFMVLTAYTESIGQDSPRQYVEEFDSRIKYYRTIRISDPDGTERAYLMYSNILNAWVVPAKERIMVRVEEAGYYTDRAR
jgi:hypothetical protein